MIIGNLKRKYPIPEIAFFVLSIAVVSAGEVSESEPSTNAPCTSENGIIPTAHDTNTPVPQYTSPILQQSLKELSVRPATYTIQQTSTDKPTPIVPHVFQQSSQALEQAAQFQQVPILQYAVRIAVPQPLYQYISKQIPVEEESNSIDREVDAQEFQHQRIVPQVQSERINPVTHYSDVSESTTQQPYSDGEDNTAVKYNEGTKATSLDTSKDDFDNNPQYVFGYDIEDTFTGDSKRQSEQRQGDVVHGVYSLIDPDGYRRTVDYTADSVNGFRVSIRREPVNDRLAKYERNSSPK
ncbi:uncharacterized protein LOC130441170 [Diorhabda sublineata]|uniref:uncharacterized protein LOC130441170 n=1 Tax=Diorhabda sublineata TaxID=1163346 RepID=UPI0024E11613|nr:uncharacterized protein LOC130441170 [Diorhabda sublineata]